MDRPAIQKSDSNSDGAVSEAAKTERERVLCFDLKTGKELWTVSYSQPYGDLAYGNGPRAAPTIQGDVVLTLGALGKLHCLNIADGSVLWSHELIKEFNGRPPMWGYAASPLVFENSVIVFAGGADGFCVIAFNLKTGELKWNSLSDKAGYSWPVLVRRNKQLTVAPCGASRTKWTKACLSPRRSFMTTSFSCVATGRDPAP
jgi:outer membrane protein assembly factor BamB